MNQNFYNYNSSGFDRFQPSQYSDVHQPPEEISMDELKAMMQSYCRIMSQRRKQAANPSEPSPVSYFYNADYDNISTPSTTYTIHLTKSATIINYPSKSTRRIYHNHDMFYDGDDDEELFPDEHYSGNKSDELINSSVKNLVPNPSESKDLSKDLSDIESDRNVPVRNDFTTVSNPLFDADNEFSSSDDKSSSDEDVLKEISNFFRTLFLMKKSFLLR
nr:hypothetical protein [Tanacetum cinerariifolium]